MEPTSNTPPMSLSDFASTTKPPRTAIDLVRQNAVDIAAALGGGWSYSEIAASLGLNPVSLELYCQRLGISMRSCRRQHRVAAAGRLSPAPERPGGQMVTARQAADAPKLPLEPERTEGAEPQAPCLAREVQRSEFLARLRAARPAKQRGTHSQT